MDAIFTENPPADLAVYVNVQEGIARLGGNKAVYMRILGRYAENSNYPALREALAQGDFAVAEEHAHTLKGTAGNLSLSKMFELSCKLDELLKEDKSSAELEAELEDAAAKTDEYVRWVLSHL